mmetsp:Transcript_8048/g.23957  ORF Transcript_8048/g.23957 Transcript_8048/m.23957 type:complete len:144 (-) Transcript_8048:284-715(-)
MSSSSNKRDKSPYGGGGGSGAGEETTPASSPPKCRRGSRSRRIYNVLAVSHSATIRTAVGRMVPDQLPVGVASGPVGRDGTVEGMLVVPNTSVTVIDVIPTPEGTRGGDDDGREAAERAMIRWTASLVELTNTDHLAVRPSVK